MTTDKTYNKLIDKLDIVEKTRITDGKFLQVLINLDKANAESAIDLINKVGLNQAMKIANQVEPFIIPKIMDRIDEDIKHSVELEDYHKSFDNKPLIAYYNAIRDKMERFKKEVLKIAKENNFSL